MRWKIPLRRNRAIPACARQILWRLPAPTFSAVHPRVRGVIFRMKLRVTCDCGSSPRERGNRCRSLHNPSRLWFIPACAEQASTVSGVTIFLRVHIPRVCEATGATTPDLPLISRAIPACAGRPVDQAARSPLYEVHPCVRRAIAEIVKAECAVNGSSPRARANLLRIRDWCNRFLRYQRSHRHPDFNQNVAVPATSRSRTPWRAPPLVSVRIGTQPRPSRLKSHENQQHQV